MHAVKHVIERYLLGWLLLLCATAFFWDRVTTVDLFVGSRTALPYIIAVTMLAIGWMLPHDEVRQVAARWPSVVGGTVVQYTAMPLLAYGLARLFRLEDVLFLGVVMVGCVPGAMASNVLTLMARGNTSYSVSLTTTATLFSPVMVPLALQLTVGHTVSQSIIWQAAVKLCWMVVLPVVAGHLLSRVFPRFESVARTVGSIVANLTILWIVAVVVALNRQHLSSFPGMVVFALLLLNLLGYAAGLIGGMLMRLTPEMRRALTLEVGMQNAGLGTALVSELFTDPRTTIPPALYTFGCMLTGTMLARVWSWKAEVRSNVAGVA